LTLQRFFRSSQWNRGCGFYSGRECLQLLDGIPNDLRVTVEVVRLQDGVRLVMAVAADGADFRDRAAGERQARNSRSPQVGEVDTRDAAKRSGVAPNLARNLAPSLR
jgi:hypothetical protein